MEDLREDILQQMRSSRPGIDNEMNEETANLALCEIEDKVMNLAQKRASRLWIAKVNNRKQVSKQKNNETGSRSPCMRPRSDPPNFGPIERGEKQTNNID